MYVCMYVCSFNQRQRTLYPNPIIKEVDISVEDQRNPRKVKKTNLDDSKFVKFV